jgi:Tol biopolymer transport system component/DNA-binding winged helix-turn-helix (wHTH) protein
MDANRTRIAFEKFEMDLRSGELRKEGRKIRLQAQPFQLLALLVKHPGEVVTREEVCQTLWRSETFVDFDHGLAVAINKIREALGDSAENPKFVETLPKRGYRFIGAIANGNGMAATGATQEAAAAEAVPEAVTNKIAAARTPRWIWIALAAGMATVALAGAAYRFVHGENRGSSSTGSVAWKPPVLFTTLPGIEAIAAFSPDGSRIAFGWNPNPAEHEQNADLYVKAIGSETVLRLTSHPSSSISPVWSPDGTQIAFHRMAGADTGIYVVPALGGPERKLRATRIPYAVALQISWSADGKWIAYTDFLPGHEEARTFLLSPETLESQQIPENRECEHQGSPAFSPDGRQLAYVCVGSMNKLSVWCLEPPGGGARKIADFERSIDGFGWAGADRLVVSQDGDLALVDVKTGRAERIPLTQNAYWPGVSRRGDKLGFTTFTMNVNIWRKDLTHPEEAAKKLIVSTREETAPDLSPDGRQVLFESTRGGSVGIWMSDADGQNVVELSKPGEVGHFPRWSPDGRKAAFGRVAGDASDIVIMDVEERVPKKLETNVGNISQPYWSHDGKWIYFRSDDPKRAGIYRCPATGGEATAISVGSDATNPQESTDGRTLYFATRMVRPNLRQVRVDEKDAKESEVEGMPNVARCDQWAATAHGIYFIPADGGNGVSYFDFATKRVRKEFRLEKQAMNGFAVSGDEKWVLYPQLDLVDGDIWIADLPAER